METKICNSCATEKSIKSFPRWINRLGFLVINKKCYSCYKSSKADSEKRRPFFDKTKNKWTLECSLCKQVKETKEFSFLKAVNRFRARCKTCINAAMKVRRDLLPLEVKREIYKKQNNHPSAIKGRKQYYASGKGAAAQKKYRQNNSEKYQETLKKKSQKWHSHTPQERAEHNLRTREIRAKSKQSYTARKKGATVVIGFKKSDIVRRDGLICYLCGKILTFDTATIEHVIPLSRGGHHKLENCKLACRDCNGRKHNKTLTEYKKFRGDYDRLKISINSTAMLN